MKSLSLNLLVVLLIASSVEGQDPPPYTASAEAEVIEIRMFINDIEATDVTVISGTPGAPGVQKEPTIVNVGDTVKIGDTVKVTCRVSGSATMTGENYSRVVVHGSFTLAGWAGSVPPWSPHNEASPGNTAFVSFETPGDLVLEGVLPGVGGYTATVNSNADALQSESGIPPWEPVTWEYVTTKLNFTVIDPPTDEIPPVITLNGDAIVTLECGVDSYTESGATAVDDVDGTVDVVIGGDVVNTEVCGTYVVAYDATDSSGNAAAQVIRTVIVQDTTDPVITLVGDNPQMIECPNAYLESGATATDNIDGDLSGSIVIDATAVDTSVPGSYFVTYDVSDAAGNAAIQVIRTVTVAAIEPVAAIEAVIDVLEDMVVPEDAEKEMGKAVTELNKAIDEFSNDKIDKALDKIAKAVKQLMKAQKEGANTQDVIDELVALVKGIADKAIEDAIATVGDDNLHVVKAQEHYDKALGNLADGKYDAAIKEFKKAYKEAMKALGE